MVVMVDKNITKLPGRLFEPIAGFGVSYQFVKAAQTAAAHMRDVLQIRDGSSG